LAVFFNSALGKIFFFQRYPFILKDAESLRAVALFNPAELLVWIQRNKYMIII